MYLHLALTGGNAFIDHPVTRPNIALSNHFPLIRHQLHELLRLGRDTDLSLLSFNRFYIFVLIFRCTQHTIHQAIKGSTLTFFNVTCPTHLTNNLRIELMTDGDT
ncbi:hypothetical protein GQX74_012889 [Glossina fuscipes]|nr:hypothetical protein GQX74_012889 [Glossina fuscipes]